MKMKLKRKVRSCCLVGLGGKGLKEDVKMKLKFVRKIFVII